jgi:hypothetical protein
MKMATCGKSCIAKSPSNFFPACRKKEGGGVVCRGGVVTWRGVERDRQQWPDEPEPFFILPVHEAEAGGDERREACPKFKRTTLRRFDQTAFSQPQPMTYGNPNHQPAEN